MMLVIYVLMIVYGYMCVEKKMILKMEKKKFYKCILLLNMELNNVIIRL